MTKLQAITEYYSQYQIIAETAMNKCLECIDPQGIPKEKRILNYLQKQKM